MVPIPSRTADCHEAMRRRRRRRVHHQSSFLLGFMILLAPVTTTVAFSISSSSSSNNKNINNYVETTTTTRRIIISATTTTSLLASSSSSSSSQQDELLKQLDDAFDYQGRMPTSHSAEDQDNANDDEANNNTNDNNNDPFRCGFVALLGAPNMGKSTLVNALLREDLCITTARPQTTRHAILGLLNGPQSQVCLVDTPGVLETPAYLLQQGMMEAVVGALRDADVLLVVTDVFSTPIPNDELFDKVQKTKKPVVVAINKVDMVKKKAKAAAAASAATTRSVVNKEDDSEDETMEEARPKVVSIEQAVALWRELLPNAVAIIPTCAKKEEDAGVHALRSLLTGDTALPEALRAMGRPLPAMFRPEDQSIWMGSSTSESNTVTAFAKLLPVSPPLYDGDILTDRTERFVASEIIRAALFTCLEKELPYCCEVRIKEFLEPKEPSTTIPPGRKSNGRQQQQQRPPKAPMIRMAADILVERDSQKVIVIGKGGALIKKVGTAAREKLEEFFQEKVYLDLNVKVDRDWRKKDDRLRAFGYIKSKK